MKFFKKNIATQQPEAIQVRRFTLKQSIAAVGALMLSVMAIAYAATAGFNAGDVISGATVDNRFLALEKSVNDLKLTGMRNVIIDGGFTINQRGYVSAAALAAGVYGHDRWKAGAAGGDYAFTQRASGTTIAIAAGKSLIQVVEDKNVAYTNYVLSWTGNAKARIGVNSATPSVTDAYAVSPILITGQLAGTTMSVEFNEGTLTNVQLENGTVATPFEFRFNGAELALCQRYYYREVLGIANIAWGVGHIYSPNTTEFI